MKCNSFIPYCIFLLIILTGCSRENGIPFDKTIAVDEPDLFARYLNPVTGLPAGDYTVVAATFSSGETGNFTVTITFDSGEQQVFNGSWTSSVGSGMGPGMAHLSSNNPAFDFTQHQPGGIDIKLEASVDTSVYLLKRGPGVNGMMNRNGPILGFNNDISVTDSQISLSPSRIDSDSYGAAYYATIDPMGVKTTLQDWKDANGFAVADAAGRVIEPRFRDVKDLGYGRGVRAWTKPDGSAYFFVENFQVRSIPGLEYSTLNLDALIGDQRQHHFGSNAIEYSTYPYGYGEPCGPNSGAACATTNPNPPKFTKFYTFDATKGSQTQPDHANETRLDTVNLDGRGNRAMPGACVYCHGGTLRPLRADGSYRDNSYSDIPGDTIDGNGNGINGDTNAKLQLMEVSSFEFSEQSPYTKSEQEPDIKRINKIIYCTYPGAHESACTEYCTDPNIVVTGTEDCDGNGNSLAAVINCVQPDPLVTSTIDVINCDGNGNDLATVIATVNSASGEWTGDFATTMAEGWYDDDPTTDAGSDGIPDFDSPVFRQDYVPPGWQPDPSDGIPPPGADQLFVEVVQPVCFVCHSRRGTNLGSNNATDGTKDIDFSTYEKFISHADLIEEYVYKRGVMPLSLRGYNAFWAGDGPKLLASFLPGGMNYVNADGGIDQPGAPIADAGPERTVPSPVRMFGANSRFVNSYNWSIISTPVGGETATLTDATTASPILTASVDGDYEIRLTVTGSGNRTDQDTVLIKIDNTPTVDPKDLVFMKGVTCTNSQEEICTIFKTSTGPQPCNNCHVDGGIVPGIPVWWDESQPATGTSWYEEVLARINFNEPEQSLILTKPSGNHHYGNLRPGFDVGNPSDRQDYDKMLNWIMEGARKE